MPATAKAIPAPLGKLDFDVMAKVNYEFFVQYVVPGYKHGQHTRFIARKLQEIEAKHAAGIPTFTIFMLPPRHSKSYTITETFPAWFIGKDQSRRVIEVSYGADLARKFGLANLQKIEGEAGRIFNMQLDPRQNAAQNFKLKDAKGGMISSGIGGAITGEGADLMIIDDPIRNRQDANSPAYRDKVYNEWKATLSTRLQPGGSVIVILTRWHEDDLAGRLLEEGAREWDVIKMPAIAGEDDVLGRPPGAPLWPEAGFNLDWAKVTEKEKGPLDWASLYQQDPRPVAGALLHREYWNYYTERPDPRSFDRIIMSWDCTFKDLETSDYVVGQVWAKKNVNYYLLDQVRERMGITGTMSAIQQLANKWPLATGVYIEDKANGTAVIEMLKNKISGLMPVTPDGGKVVRAQAVLPLVAARNVFLPSADLEPWVTDFVHEAAAFPYGKHDDQVDAATQALNVLANEIPLFIGRA